MPIEAVDFIDKLLQLNPIARLGAGAQGGDNDIEKLKAHNFFSGINFNMLRKGDVAPPIPSELIDNFERL